MTAIRSICLSAALLACATLAHAQRYRLIIGRPNSPVVTIAEFRPCVPAEGSDCGAFIDRDVDTRVDSSFGGVPGVLDRVRTTNGHYALSFAAVAVRITSVTMPDSNVHHDVRDGDRTPRAIVAAPDSRYAFAVFQALNGTPDEICMIDLGTHSIIARLGLKREAAGLAMVP